MDLANEELAHYGVKGMKWGVRRSPEQLGHRRSSGVSNKVGAAKKKIGEAKKTAEKLEADRRKALVDKAMRPGASKKDVKKALPYMSDKDIQAKLDRRQLESKLISGPQKQGGMKSALKKGVELGTTDAAKDVYGTFAKETLKPIATASGKALGQKLLTKTAEVAIDRAAGKYGIDADVAKEAASVFKTSISEDFAATAKSQRDKFSEKNNLGKAWEKGKADAKKKLEKEAEKAQTEKSDARKAADAAADAKRAEKKKEKHKSDSSMDVNVANPYPW